MTASSDGTGGSYRLVTTGPVHRRKSAESDDGIIGRRIEGHLRAGRTDVYETAGRLSRGMLRGDGALEVKCETESNADGEGQLSVFGGGRGTNSPYEFTANYGVYRSDEGSLEGHDHNVTTDSVEGEIYGKRDDWRTKGELKRFWAQPKGREIRFDHAMRRSSSGDRKR